jgi:hypothetical protein
MRERKPGHLLQLLLALGDGQLLGIGAVRPTLKHLLSFLPGAMRVSACQYRGSPSGPRAERRRRSADFSGST